MAEPNRAPGMREQEARTGEGSWWGCLAPWLRPRKSPSSSTTGDLLQEEGVHQAELVADRPGATATTANKAVQVNFGDVIAATRGVKRKFTGRSRRRARKKRKVNPR
ncbi:uncharacterized protein LOC144154975 [Haemaphysalis longicornis]